MSLYIERLMLCAILLAFKCLNSTQTLNDVAKSMGRARGVIPLRTDCEFSLSFKGIPPRFQDEKKLISSASEHLEDNPKYQKLSEKHNHISFSSIVALWSSFY